MPYSKVMLHCIWATKARAPIISKELKPLLLNHIKENSFNKEIHIDCLNCVEEHIHLLISVVYFPPRPKGRGNWFGTSSFG